MAGELGLEPRMTVPKTGVLPLHHSPAGPAFPEGLPPREAVRYAKPFRDATGVLKLRSRSPRSGSLLERERVLSMSRLTAERLAATAHGAILAASPRLPGERTDNFRLGDLAACGGETPSL